MTGSLKTFFSHVENGLWPRGQYVRALRARHALNSMFLQKFNSECFGAPLALPLGHNDKLLMIIYFLICQVSKTSFQATMFATYALNSMLLQIHNSEAIPGQMEKTPGFHLFSTSHGR